MLDTGCDLSVTVQRRFDKTYVTLTGELDMSTVNLLIDALGGIDPADQAGVVVHIGALDFLGACGMNAVAAAASRLALSCCPLMIAGANPFQRKSLIAGGMASFLTTTEFLVDRREIGDRKRRPDLVGAKKAS